MLFIFIGTHTIGSQSGGSAVQADDGGARAICTGD